MKIKVSALINSQTYHTVHRVNCLDTTAGYYYCQLKDGCSEKFHKPMWSRYETEIEYNEVETQCK
jgi:hypothetical protein